MEIKDSPTLFAKNIMEQRKAQNLPVYNGGLGENPLPAPMCLQDEIVKYKHRKEYTFATGITELKEQLGDKIVVGNGSKELLFVIQLAFHKLYPNGKIFYLYPAWVSYMDQARMLGINFVGIRTNDEYKVNLDQLDQELSLCDKSMIIFNSPCNPTGILYTKDEIKKIASIFSKHNTIVINDEIYSGLVHDDYVNSYGELDKEYPHNTINSSSLSKTFACGGYRLGWLVFPNNPDLDSLYKLSASLALSIYSCPSVLFQYVAAKALTYPQEIKDRMIFQRKMFSELGKYVHMRLSKLNLHCSVPQAAWYIWIDFRNYKTKLNKLNIFNSGDIVKYLVQTFGIIFVPGDAFGSDENEICCRYSYIDVDFDLDKGTYNITKIKDCMDILENWLNF